MFHAKKYVSVRVSVITSTVVTGASVAITTQATFGEIVDQTEYQPISSWLTGVLLDDQQFGASVAMFNRNLVIGAPYQMSNQDPNFPQLLFPYGAAFTLNESKTDWDYGLILEDSAVPNDGCVYSYAPYSGGWQMGDAVAVNQSHLVVGAPSKNVLQTETDVCYSKAGSVYVYEKAGFPLLQVI